MEEEIIIRYKIKNEKRIRIFGNKFVENNKNRCKVKVKEEIIEIKEYYYINEDEKENEYLDILLIGINNIIDMSYMFSNCSSLSSLPDI